jgi:hypothetical protein
MSSKPTRRSFFGQASAALAAPLAATAALAGESRDGGDVAARLAALEDTNAIRALHQRYARLVTAGAGARAELTALFADPVRAVVAENVRSLTPDGEVAVTIAADGTATARVACTVETATPIEPCGTLVDMARLQGDGVLKRSEQRALESSFVKRDGVWQFVNAGFQA